MHDILGVGNQLANLALVLGFGLLGLLHLNLVAIDKAVTLVLGKHAVALGGIDAALELNDARSAIDAQGIDLF